MSAKPKRFVCPHEFCQKDFTRADHLRRHMLNHGVGNYTCPRCRLHFKRPDLLDRHVARHRERDAEAGGEGLGFVESRKKLWRDVDGQIVQKRPSRVDIGRLMMRGESLDLAPQSPTVPSDCRNAQQAVQTEPSSSERLSSRGDLLTHNATPPKETAQYLGFTEAFLGFDMYEFLASSPWDFQTNGTEMQLDDPVNATTNQGSSSSMHYTLMNNHDWLIDPAGSVPMTACQNLNNIPTTQNYNQGSLLHNFPHHLTNPPRCDMPSFGSSAGSGSRLPVSAPQQPTLPLLQHANQQTMEHSSTSLPSGVNAIRMPALSDYAQSPNSRWEAGSPASFLAIPESSIDMEREMSGKRPLPQTAVSPPPLNSEVLSPGRPEPHMPILSEESCDTIFDLLVDNQPSLPEHGMVISKDHPLLTLSSMQDYLNLFFSCFNASYPMLHQATFDTSQQETLLLAAVILLGASYSENSLGVFADRMYDTLRVGIFHSVAFSATPELWMLQTLFLLECFAQKQHDMAHVFHGILVNLMRRSDCLTVRCASFSDESQQDLDTRWRSAIDTELRKRLACVCFLWDTQNAVLFSHAMSMSAFEIRTTLPCHWAAWEASSADEWWRHAKRESPMFFQSVLKTYLEPDSGEIATDFDAFSYLLVLNGLLSIQCEMKQFNRITYGFLSQQPSDRANWQDQFTNAYEKWKVDYDTYCLNMISLDESHSRQSHFARFRTSTNAIYHIAHITLNIDVLDILIYAGARHVKGRRVTRADYDRSRTILKEWAKSHGSAGAPAAKAAWHAAHLLRDSVLNLKNFDVTNTFYYPWRLYVSIITCWAFHSLIVVGLPASPPPQTHDEHGRASTVASSDASVESRSRWRAESEMNALVSSMTSVMPENLSRLLARYSTSGLTTVMAERLSRIKWVVIQEGIKLLRDLVPGRTVHDYDGPPEE